MTQTLFLLSMWDQRQGCLLIMLHCLLMYLFPMECILILCFASFHHVFLSYRFLHWANGICRLVCTMMTCLFFLSIHYAVMQFTLVIVCFFFQDKIKLWLFTGFKNLKKLVLEIGAEDDESLLLFTPLIKACPYLQIFVFKVRVFLVKANSHTHTYI